MDVVWKLNIINYPICRLALILPSNDYTFKKALVNRNSPQLEPWIY